jgi:hypothetical protein
VFKDTRLLIGLGIGLILGALLLELMNVAVNGVSQDPIVNDANNDILTTPYTFDQLSTIADKLGFNIIEKSVVYYTQADMDKAIEDAKKSDTPQSAASIEKPLVDELVEEQSDDKEDENKGTLEEVVDKETYSIEIQSGMVTSGVSSMLLSVGLISDVESFEKELSRRNLNKSIQVGIFRFDKKPSLTELINKITTP